MSSKATEVRKLLRAAEEQGFTYERSNAGHWKVTSPDGQVAKLSSTPHSDRGVTDNVMRLRRIGYEPPLPPKPKSKRSADQQDPDPDHVPDPNPVSPTEEDQSMAKLSEVARVTGGVLPVPPDDDDDDLMPSTQIADNLPLAGYLVWQHVMDEIRASDGKRHPLRGVDGWEWLGSRQGMISRIWPDLARPDYSTEPATMPQERRLLGAYLTGSRNMAVLETGSKERRTLWWVREDWAEVPASSALTLANTPQNEDWWQRKVTPEEAGETRGAFPVTSMFRCPDCAFTTHTASSLGTHKAKLAGTAHPTGRWPCPVEWCKEVRGDTTALANHLSRDHRALGLHTCRVCGDVFESKAERASHAARMHGSGRRTVTSEEAIRGLAQTSSPPLVSAPRAPVAPTPASVPVVTEAAPTVVPAPVVAQPAADAASYLQQVIADAARLPLIEARVRELERRNTELEEENDRLRKRDQELATWLNSYPFKR